MDLKTALKYVSGYENKRQLLHSVQSVNNIIEAVLFSDKTYSDQTRRLAPLFKGSTHYETCNNIFAFLRNNITYVADQGDQLIKSPAALLNTGTGDCKSFSVFTGSILKNLGISYSYSFVGFDSKNISHVFVISNNITIDAVWHNFNETKNFNIQKLKKMSVFSVNGTDEATKRVAVPIIAKDFAKLLLAASSKIESKGTQKTVLLTVNEVDNIIKKASQISEIAGFNPFKWVKNQVQAVRTTLKDILGDKTGDTVFFGLIGLIGGGGIGSGIGILVSLGTTKITAFDGSNFGVKLTDQEIAALQNPDENKTNYNNVITKLAAEFSALAYITAATYAKDKYLSDITNQGKLSVKASAESKKIGSIADYKLDPKEDKKTWINKAWEWATGWLFGHPDSEWSKTPEAVKRVIMNFLIWKCIFEKRLNLIGSNDPFFYIFDFMKNNGWLAEDPNLTVQTFFQKNAWAFNLVCWAYGVNDLTYSTRNANTKSFVQAYISQQGSTSAAPDPEGYDPEFYPQKKYYNTSENNTISSATKNLLSTYDVPITNDMTVSQAVLALKLSGVNVPASVVDDESLRQWLIANPGNGKQGGGGNSGGSNDKKSNIIIPLGLLALLLN